MTPACAASFASDTNYLRESWIPSSAPQDYPLPTAAPVRFERASSGMAWIARQCRPPAPVWLPPWLVFSKVPGFRMPLLNLMSRLQSLCLLAEKHLCLSMLKEALRFKAAPAHSRSSSLVGRFAWEHIFQTRS